LSPVNMGFVQKIFKEGIDVHSMHPSLDYVS